MLSQLSKHAGIIETPLDGRKQNGVVAQNERKVAAFKSVPEVSIIRPQVGFKLKRKKENF